MKPQNQELRNEILNKQIDIQEVALCNPNVKILLYFNIKINFKIKFIRC